MPFTPSHIAAVLPFVRTPLVPSALVIGSMGPDLFYYLPFEVDRGLSHSPLGIVTIDLAFGLVVFLLWRVVFRRPVVDFTPLQVRARLATVRGRAPVASGAVHLGLAVVSILLGSATHVVWDAFTHAGWLVDRLPVLSWLVGPTLVYKWLQYASSAGGGIVVVLWIVSWYRRTTPTEAPATRLTGLQRLLGWGLVVASGLGVSLVLWIGGMVRGLSPLFPSLVFDTVTIGLGAAGLAAAVVSLVWWSRPVQAQAALT